MYSGAFGSSSAMHALMSRCVRWMTSVAFVVFGRDEPVCLLAVRGGGIARGHVRLHAAAVHKEMARSSGARLPRAPGGADRLIAFAGYKGLGCQVLSRRRWARLIQLGLLSVRAFTGNRQAYSGQDQSVDVACAESIE
jgi:hypothetical protein